MPNKRGGSSGVSSVVAPAAAPVAATTPAPAPQPTLTPQQRLAQLRQNINSLSDFASLPYDDKMDLIDAALKTPTPAGKPNTA
ncbi:MAG: hypothetical protein ILP19_10040, partial [Oscillospiraceae bacterium]|nr:hypothetical protein [Oscillospiraceae bacterium]